MWISDGRITRRNSLPVTSASIPRRGGASTSFGKRPGEMGARGLEPLTPALQWSRDHVNRCYCLPRLLNGMGKAPVTLDEGYGSSILLLTFC
jgi:hypothetical protein